MGNTTSLGIGDDDSGWLFHVLEFCDSRSRKNCTFVSKRYFQIQTSESSFKWRLLRLHIEKGLYSPPYLPKSDNKMQKITWRSLFLDLHMKSNLWGKQESMNTPGVDRVNNNMVGNEEHLLEEKINQSMVTGSTENFMVDVCARFKPKEDDNNNEEKTKTEASLPLHQRLALVKLSNNVTSNKEAFCILKERGELFKELWAADGKDKNKNELINANEDSNVLCCGLHSIDEEKSRVIMVDQTKGLREFYFDNVFNGLSPQNIFYESSARRLVVDFINGYNATVIVYGQTGSGKTYTMFGPQRNGTFESYQKESWGIIPRACKEVLDATQFRRTNLNLNIESSLSVTYVEVYGNEVTDLLQQKKESTTSHCSYKTTTAVRIVLDGSVEVPINSLSEVVHLLQIGDAQKKKATTAMNEKSSRAHAIFILKLKQRCVNTGVNKISKLFLADLGGSEQVKKSQIEAGKTNFIGNKFCTGFVKSDRMREAVNINLGLMSLKSCVEGLHSGNAYVPYANSKLTMILSEGLGGDSKTSVIICSSQESQHTNETIAALKFGQSCRQVCKAANNTGVNDMLEAILTKVDDEIKQCEDLIQLKERWEVREEMRVDNLAEQNSLESQGFGGIEMKKTTILVGAEEEHRRLNELLQTRASLTGMSMDSTQTNNSGNRFGGNVGFGNAHLYGLGTQYNIKLEENNNNARFQNTVNKEDLPAPIKKMKVAGEGVVDGWKSGKNINVDQETLSHKAKTINRNKLVYSGISS